MRSVIILALLILFVQRSFAETSNDYFVHDLIKKEVYWNCENSKFSFSNNAMKFQKGDDSFSMSFGFLDSNSTIYYENPVQEIKLFGEKFQHIKLYRQIRISNPAKRLELVLKMTDNKFKYEVVCFPGFDRNSLFNEIKNINSITKFEDKLLFVFGEEVIADTEYKIYTQKNGITEILDNGLVTIENQCIRYDIPKELNNEKIIIDPTIVWSTYLGSAGSFDNVTGLANDEEGNIYLTGIVASSKYFPFANSVDSLKSGGSDDIFLIKMDSEKNTLWTAIFGGNGFDYPYQIEYYRNKLYLSGETRSYNFPRRGPVYQTNHAGNSDAFAAIFDIDGTLEFSGIFGGEGYDSFTSIANLKDKLVFMGRSFSINVATTPNAIKTKYSGSGYEGLIVSLNSNSNEVEMCSYYGGTRDDFIESCFTDDDENIYISGFTGSSDLKFDYYENLSVGVKYDAFVQKFDKNLNPVWKLNLGGNGEDYASNILRYGNKFYILGYTTSTNLKVNDNSHQKNKMGDLDAFLSVHNLEDGKLEWLTYIGGPGNEGRITTDAQFSGLIVSGVGDITVLGETYGPTFPVITGNNSVDGESDIFLCKYTKDGYLIESEIFGGSGKDRVYDSKIINGSLFLSGFTSSADFPINGSYFQKELFGNFSGFVVQLNSCIGDGFDVNNFYGDDRFSPLGDIEFVDQIAYISLAKQFQKGALKFKYPINLSQGFDTKFTFRVHGNMIGNSPEKIADGFAFVISKNKILKAGDSGGGIGYIGLDSCFVVEFDNYNNDTELHPDINDPWKNHVAVFNGFDKKEISGNHLSSNNLATHQLDFWIGPEPQSFYGRLMYDFYSDKLMIWFDSSNAISNPIISIDDFSKYLPGQTHYYLAITSATGQFFQNHIIDHWEICANAPNAINYDTIPNSIENTPKSVAEPIISPNPFNSEFKISIGKNYSAFANLRIIDLSGNVVIKSDFYNEQLINASKLATGIYIAEIKIGERYYYKKLIKDKP